MRWLLGLALLPVLLAVLLACPGRPRDPLADDRARLAELERSPPTPGWPAEASALISEAALARQLEQGFANALAERGGSFRINTPLGFDLEVQPLLKVTEVALADSPSCATCVQATLSIGGEVRTGVVAGEATAGRSFAVEASSRGELEVRLQRREQGGAVVTARPVAPESWQISVALADLPMAWNLGLSQLLEDQLIGYLQQRPPEDLQLLQLEDESSVRIRDLRLRGRGGGQFAIEFSFQVLAAGQVAPEAQGDADLTVLVPAATLLGIARAAALRSPPVDGHAVEPIRLELAEDRFSLWLRLWTVASRPSARDFLVEGRFELDPEAGVQLRAERSRELGPAGSRLDPLGLLTRTAILAKLEHSLSAMLPAKVQRPVLGQVAELSVQRVRAEQGVLVISAGFALRPAASSPDDIELDPATRR